MLSTRELLDLAKKHAAVKSSMQSSALICLRDAEMLFNRGEFQRVKIRAIHSLQYSIGVFHPDYKKATENNLSADLRP